MLNEWAENQDLPVIAVGDYNFDWEVVGGDQDHDEGFDLLTAGVAMVSSLGLAQMQESADIITARFGLVFCLLLSCAVATSASQETMERVSITMKQTVALVNTPFTVPVYLAIPTNLEIGSFTFEVVYPEDVFSLLKVERGFQLQPTHFTLKANAFSHFSHGQGRENRRDWVAIGVNDEILRLAMSRTRVGDLKTKASI